MVKYSFIRNATSIDKLISAKVLIFEYLEMVWNILLFQKVCDGNAFLATLRLDIFDLFSCKHIVSLC